MRNYISEEVEEEGGCYAIHLMLLLYSGYIIMFTSDSSDWLNYELRKEHEFSHMEIKFLSVGIQYFFNMES